MIENDEIIDFIKQNNLESKLVKLRNNKIIHKVRLASLKAVDNNRNSRDFMFEYNENNIFYIFITIEENPIFCVPIIQDKAKSKFSFYTNHNIKSPYFNFDYNKFLINLNVCQRPTLESNIEILYKIPLQRETTLVSHTTKDNIEYYKEMKNVITKESSTANIETFAGLADKFFIIEVENRKSESEILLKEDGIISIHYIVTKDKDELVELYTMIKYSIFYIKESLTNYVSKYIYDIIYDFTHLPNENLLKFLENFGIIITKNDTQKITFPIKQKVKAFRSLYNENKIMYLNKQIPNIKKGKNITSVPFYKFIRLINKYDLYNYDKEVKIKQSQLKKKRKFSFLNSSCVLDEISDKISKEHKLNLDTILSNFMKRINENLKEYTNIDNPETIDKFMLSSLNKYILQYSQYKGFFNIDIVLNEDSMIDLHCCNTKKINNFFNKQAYKILSKCLNICNLFFDFNEGFFHKHFNILDNSYNFNEKNIIHTFPSCFDSSKKNKIRIYDIPMLEKWSCQIANLILLIWKDNNYLGVYEKKDREVIQADLNFKKKSENKFLNFFSTTLTTISEELFTNYEEAFPDYYLFCNRISKFPLNKYNHIDNVCQHFTNSSIQILLQKNIIYFHPFNLVYNTSNNNEADDYNSRNLSFPNLKTVIEPYLIYVDDALIEYIDVKEKKENYLRHREITLETYLEELKAVNAEKINYNLILGWEKNQNINNQLNKSNSVNLDTIERVDQEDKDLTVMESKTFFSIPDIKNYNFSFLLNLSYFFIHKLTQEVKEKLIDFCILKRYINSIETSQNLSFDGYDGSVLRKTPKNKVIIKNQCKRVKAILLKNLNMMSKIKSYSENMLLIFYNYMKSVILEIKINKGFDDNSANYPFPNTFIKVGYMLVNLKSMEEENSVDKFLKSDYYSNFKNY